MPVLHGHRRMSLTSEQSRSRLGCPGLPLLDCGNTDTVTDAQAIAHPRTKRDQTHRTAEMEMRPSSNPTRATVSCQRSALIIARILIPPLPSALTHHLPVATWSRPEPGDSTYIHSRTTIYAGENYKVSHTKTKQTFHVQLTMSDQQLHGTPRDATSDADCG